MAATTSRPVTVTYPHGVDLFALGLVLDAGVGETLDDPLHLVVEALLLALQLVDQRVLTHKQVTGEASRHRSGHGSDRRTRSATSRLHCSISSSSTATSTRTEFSVSADSCMHHAATPAQRCQQLGRDSGASTRTRKRGRERDTHPPTHMAKTLLPHPPHKRQHR
jgi:hypothetical protein